MPLSIFVLLFVILAALLTVVAVMYYGSKENLDVHMDNPEAIASVTIWRERAERLERARSGGLVSVKEAEGASQANKVIVDPAEADARRAAAMARKAARANKS